MVLTLFSLFSLFCPFFVAFSSAGIAAYQAVPWNDFYMEGAPFSNQMCSQMPFSSAAGGQYFTEQVSYTQPPCLPSSPCFRRGPNGTTLGSMPHTGKQKEVTPPDQSSYQNHQTEPELTSLAEREEVESSSKEGEIIVGNWTASWFFLGGERGDKERVPRQQLLLWMQDQNCGMNGNGTFFFWVAVQDRSSYPV